MARQLLGTAPINASDATTKGYVDALVRITNLNKNPDFTTFSWINTSWAGQDPTQITLDSVARGPFGGNSLKIVASKNYGGVEITGADLEIGKQYVTSFY